MIRVIAVCLIIVCGIQPLQAKKNNDSVEDVIRDVIRDEIDDDNDHKGKGRPYNPGEHGRDNARDKQCQNPGKGSKCVLLTSSMTK